MIVTTFTVTMGTFLRIPCIVKLPFPLLAAAEETLRHL